MSENDNKTRAKRWNHGKGRDGVQYYTRDKKKEMPIVTEDKVIDAFQSSLLGMVNSRISKRETELINGV